MSVGAVNKQTGDRIPTAGMPAIDSVLSGASTNPVQNRVVKAALDEKQPITDNTLQTTDKTVPGAINELKSGLTNVSTTLENMPMKQWQKNTSGSAGNVTFTFSSSVNRYAGLLFCVNNSGVSAIFAVAYKEDTEPIITRLAGSDAVTPSISSDGSITVGLYAWSTAILFANGNFV